MTGQYVGFIIGLSLGLAGWWVMFLEYRRDRKGWRAQAVAAADDALKARGDATALAADLDHALGLLQDERVRFGGLSDEQAADFEAHTVKALRLVSEPDQSRLQVGPVVVPMQRDGSAS